MANNINLTLKYQAALDSAYKKGSKTSILDVPNTLIRQTPDEKSILLPQMTLNGLANYSRNNGFTAGDVTLEWVTYTLQHDRGRSFQVDKFDNLESAGIAFGSLANEFLKQHVIPEVDCYKIAKLYAGALNKEAEVVTSDNILTSIDSGIAVMDEAEVGETDRVLFVSVPVYMLMKQSTQLQRRFDVQNGVASLERDVEVFDGMPIVKMPTSRMKSAYTFGSNGFVPAIGAKDINFMIVHRPAQVSLVKTAQPRIFTPEVNQSADAYKFDYRIYMDCFVIDNKQSGIYVSEVSDDS